jgi:hypothetical protein
MHSSCDRSVLEDIIRAREVAFNVVGNVTDLEGEKIPSISVGEGLVQVENVHAIYLAMKQSVDQQTPSLGLVGSSRDIGDFRHI